MKFLDVIEKHVGLMGVARTAYATRGLIPYRALLSTAEQSLEKASAALSGFSITASNVIENTTL